MLYDTCYRVDESQNSRPIRDAKQTIFLWSNMSFPEETSQKTKQTAAGSETGTGQSDGQQHLGQRQHATSWLRQRVYSTASILRHLTANIQLIQSGMNATQLNKCKWEMTKGMAVLYKLTKNLQGTSEKEMEELYRKQEDSAGSNKNIFQLARQNYNSGS